MEQPNNDKELSFKEKLAKAKKSASEGGNYEDLPLDTYNMKLKQAFVNQSKGKRNQTNFDWEVIEGELAGKTHRSFDNLDHEVGLSIFVQNMEKMGYDASEAESLDDIDAMIKDLASKGAVCTITIFEKKGYRNTKLVEFLGLTDEEEQGGATPKPTPDEPDEPSIEVGSKLNYKVGDKTVVGVVKSINYENETLDFPFHKGVAVDDVVAQA